MNLEIGKSYLLAIFFKLSMNDDLAPLLIKLRVFPNLTDSNAKRKEVKYGRENLVLENDYLIKFKGDWGQIVH